MQYRANTHSPSGVADDDPHPLPLPVARSASANRRQQRHDAKAAMASTVVSPMYQASEIHGITCYIGAAAAASWSPADNPPARYAALGSPPQAKNRRRSPCIANLRRGRRLNADSTMASAGKNRSASNSKHR
ncbi:MAG: hypothetical protein IPL99_11270 [Candidatus Competibacteraceae bacterium]|nr:hypothetical protein [Candidatus Competibacteraceae bacterium]